MIRIHFIQYVNREEPFSIFCLPFCPLHSVLSESSV